MHFEALSANFDLAKTLNRLASNQSLFLVLIEMKKAQQQSLIVLVGEITKQLPLSSGRFFDSLNGEFD
jgi:hypothetical protein